MKSLTWLVWCTFIYFVRGDLVAADDILAMLQSSLRVNLQGQESEQPQMQDAGVPDMTSISKLEEIVMAKVREGLGGDNKLTAQINTSVKTMYTAIIATTAENQAKIRADIKAFALCKTKMWAAYDKAMPIEKEFWVLGEIYPKCRVAEEKLKDIKTATDEIHNSTHTDLQNKKKLAKITENSCKNVCTNNKFENYEEQLKRFSGYYKKCVEKIEPCHDAIKNATNKFEKTVKKKGEDDGRYKAMKNKCDLIAYRMNKKKCLAVDKLTGGCSFYEECWKKAKKIYEADTARIMVEEANMMIQWRALTRVQCFLLVLNTQNDKDKTKEKAQLEKCIGIKKTDISTTHLNIDYDQQPSKPKCPKDPWCPCTQGYLNYYYKAGPKKRCVTNIVPTYTCAACPEGAPKKKR